MKQHRLDFTAPYSMRAFVREKLRDLPERQRAREEKRKELIIKRGRGNAELRGRSEAELDREAQPWLEGTRGYAQAAAAGTSPASSPDSSDQSSFKKGD